MQDCSSRRLRLEAAPSFRQGLEKGEHIGQIRATHLPKCVMSAFTSSESTSVTKTSGGKVIGGPINGKGSLTIEVKGTGTIIV